MAQAGLFIGVDGGGTGCRARLADAQGRVLGEGVAGPANIRFGLDESFASVRDAALGSLAAAGLLAERLGEVVACLGLAGASEPDSLALARAHPHPFRAALVAADAHIACVGAHPDGDGGIVIVGTGAIGWAVVEGRAVRVGGWGHPVSDEGSGAWLGAEAIRRTLWARDGRAPWTDLLTAVAARFDHDPHAIVRWTAGAKPRDFGTLAPLVVEHARLGDANAVSLLQQAAGHVDALAERLVAAGAGRIALGGGLAPHVRSWLSPPTVERLVAPAGDALSGALHLARAHARTSGLL